MTSQELREEKAKLVKDARAIFAKAESEKRTPTKEEQAEFDRHFARVDEIDEQLTRQDRLEKSEAELNSTNNRKSDKNEPGQKSEERNADPSKQPVKVQFRAGRPGERESRDYTFHPGSREHNRCHPGSEYNANFRHWIATGENRGLFTGSDADGGYTTVPETLVATFLKNVDDATFLNQLTTTLPPTNAQSYGIRRRTAKAATWARGQELTTPTADTSMKFGKKLLTPHHATGLAKVSKDLLRISDMNIEGFVMDELALDLAEMLEVEFMTGTGANSMLGIFTASSDGISTSRDVSTGNSTTAISADGLINALYTLKAQYMARATWMFHRDAVKQIRKLKDGEGQYLWRAGISEGEPNTILGRPFVMSEWAPNTFTTGQYVGIVGDFSYFWQGYSLQMDMQRLNELYAGTNEVGFIGRVKQDGMPVLEEAFVRVKLG